MNEKVQTMGMICAYEGSAHAVDKQQVSCYVSQAGNQLIFDLDRCYCINRDLTEKQLSFFFFLKKREY